MNIIQYIPEESTSSNFLLRWKVQLSLIQLSSIRTLLKLEVVCINEENIDFSLWSKDELNVNQPFALIIISMSSNSSVI